MKHPVLAALLVSAALTATASGQVKSVAAANNQPTKPSTGSQASSNTTRARVLAADSQPVPTGSIVSSGILSPQSKPTFNSHGAVARFRRATTSPTAPLDSVKTTSSASPDSLVVGASLLKSSSKSALPANTPAGAISLASTQVYRVGVRDVLDIKLTNQPGRSSTLFTVLEDGVVEYPLAGGPIVVDGLTTTEIAALLRQRVKIFDNPAVEVTVRDYASHEVTISGLVAAPGAKVLRREAVPLYTVLAEALILPEAERATINRQGRSPMVVVLKDASLSATLVVPGDVIKVSGPSAAPTEFFFVGGAIGSPGQKPYHAGLTLTQAILASGGTSPSAGAKVKVSRQGTDGRLGSEEYNLRKIQSGKTPDPILQNGDRIEVTAEK